MNEARVHRMIREVQAAQPTRVTLWPLAALAIASLFAGCVGAATPAWDLKPGVNVYSYEPADPATLSARLLVYLPHDFASRRLPLILSLHGAGSRGSDPEKLKTNLTLRYATTRSEFPFVVAIPQAPAGASGFDTASLSDLLDELVERIPVDRSRIYVTGSSMGASAAWKLVAAQPYRFAAIVAVASPRPNLPAACSIRDTPVWAFHNAGDNVADVAPVRDVIDALANCHGAARLTIYPQAGHDAWSETYANPQLYDWLAAQSRPQGCVSPETCP